MMNAQATVDKGIKSHSGHWGLRDLESFGNLIASLDEVVSLRDDFLPKTEPREKFPCHILINPLRTVTRRQSKLTVLLAGVRTLRLPMLQHCADGWIEINLAAMRRKKTVVDARNVNASTALAEELRDDACRSVLRVQKRRQLRRWGDRHARSATAGTFDTRGRCRATSCNTATDACEILRKPRKQRVRVKSLPQTTQEKKLKDAESIMYSKG